MAESGKEAIEEVRAQFPVLFNDGKFDELGRWFYAEDAIALPYGQDPIEGRVAICSYFDELWKNAGLRFDLGVIQTVAGDDIGIPRWHIRRAHGGRQRAGRYARGVSAPVGRVVEVHRRYVAQLGGVEH